MPSDPTPPTPNPTPGGKPRRRPAPGMGGNWLLVAIVICVIALFAYGFNVGTTNALEWGDFISLISNKDAPTFLKKVVFVGTSRVSGELVDNAKLPEDLAYLAPKLKSGRFTVQKLQTIEDKALQERLTAIKEESRPTRPTTSRPSTGINRTSRFPC